MLATTQSRPRQRAPRRVAAPLLTLVTASLTLLFSLSLPGVALTQAQPVRNAPDTTIQPPELSATAVYAYDATAGVELFARNADERLPVASTIKIATALVVVEHAELDEEVTIIESDLVDITLSSNMGLNGLVAGDTFTVEQLLVGLLVPSGSDAANALARHVGMKLADTEDAETGYNAFVDEMNTFVRDLGFKNTQFTNPAGDDSANSFSSAYDLARLGGRLMRNPTLAAIVAEPYMRVISVGPEGRIYEEDGTNQLLGQFGVVGMKTGSTTEAGACLISARLVNDGGNTIITVVLGSDLVYDANNIITTDGRWADTEAIFRAMDETFRWVAPSADGVMPGLGEQLAVWGVSMREPPAIPVPNDADYAIRYQLVLVPPDGDKQTGRILIYFGEDEVGALPLYPEEAASPALVAA